MQRSDFWVTNYSAVTLECCLVPFFMSALTCNQLHLCKSGNKYLWAVQRWDNCLQPVKLITGHLKVVCSATFVPALACNVVTTVLRPVNLCTATWVLPNGYWSNVCSSPNTDWLGGCTATATVKAVIAVEGGDWRGYLHLQRSFQPIYIVTFSSNFLATFLIWLLYLVVCSKNLKKWVCGWLVAHHVYKSSLRSQ